MKYRVIASLSVVATVITLASGMTLSTNQSVCDFQPSGTFNPALPASHVENQCARVRDGVEQVSWLSWFAGQSSSYQFHFIDLLELLHRGDSPHSTLSND